MEAGKEGETMQGEKLVEEEEQRNLIIQHFEHLRTDASAAQQEISCH